MSRIHRVFGHVDLQTMLASSSSPQPEQNQPPSKKARLRTPDRPPSEKGRPLTGGPPWKPPSTAGAAEQDRPIPRHFEGIGKGSLGDNVPPPNWLCSSEGGAYQLAPGIKMTEEEIAKHIEEHYKPMKNVWRGNVTDLAKGMTVLWKGIKKGPRGGESTVAEWFHGKFHGWHDAWTAYVN